MVCRFGLGPIVLVCAVGFAGACSSPPLNEVPVCQDDAECESGICHDEVCLEPDGDFDGDGVQNGDETLFGTRYDHNDTDKDGLSDRVEVGSEEAPTDTDGDGVIDALESNVEDGDSDCLTDHEDALNDAAAAALEHCPAEGVCLGQAGVGLVVTCADGANAPTCVFEGVAGYEAVEASCDGLDNDCDGEVDPEGVAAACEDGDACTEDRCWEGACENAALDCSDGIDCTTDSCDAEVGCLHVGDDAVCDDGNPCTGGGCDETAGCTGLALDGPCDDGDPCTLEDFCQAGECESGLGVLACDDGEVCTEDSCVAGEGCASVAVAGACDDGDPCTLGDACEAGACVAGLDLALCDDDAFCTDDSCVAGVGCVAVPLAAGQACEDDEVCTLGDVCDGAGACAAGAWNLCDDGSDCTEDACEAGVGCTHPAVAAQVACDDGDACTAGDACDGAGLCVGGAAVDCDDGQPCSTEACDVALGCVETGPAASGTACDDGEPCTEDDACDGSGACGLGVAVVCDDGEACTVDGCEPGVGCAFAPVAVGEGCDDGDACTEGDACDGMGGCQGGGPVDCDDGNACTVAVCDSDGVGCGALPMPNTTGCDDGDDCTLDDHCEAGVCVGGGPNDCDDGSPCTTDGCAEGACSNVPLGVGASCSDGDACTLGDACDGAGVCATTGELTCVDDDPCTDNLCDAELGCVFPQLGDGSMEVCFNGIDDDCDGSTDVGCTWLVDADSLAVLGDGASWDTAFQTLGEAVAQAVAGDEIWVAEGAYQGGVMKDGVDVVGGFDATETNKHDRQGQRPLVLAKPGSASVLVGASDAVYEHLRIAGGNSGGSGGGLHCAPCVGLELRDMHFSDNTASGAGGHIWAGMGSHLTLTEGTWIEDGSASVGGGIALEDDAVLEVLQATFLENAADAGGALHVSGNARTIVLGAGASFVGNAADQGAAVYVGGAGYITLDADGAWFSGNQSKDGGAVYGDNALLDLDLCTFSENTVKSGPGGPAGVFTTGSATLEADGCTFVGNTDGGFLPGGAVSAGGPTTVTGGVFAENTGTANRGAFHVSGSEVGQQVVLTDVLFQSNVSTQGQALTAYNSGAELLVQGCEFRDHSVQGNGTVFSDAEVTFAGCVFDNSVGTGGGHVIVTRPAAVHDCLFVDGQSLTNGGAISAHGLAATELVVFNSTFVNNSAGDSGGAISVGDGQSATIVQSSFWGNNAPDGGVVGLFGFFGVPEGDVAFVNVAAYGNGDTVGAGIVATCVGSCLEDGEAFDGCAGLESDPFVPSEELELFQVQSSNVCVDLGDDSSANSYGPSADWWLSMSTDAAGAPDMGTVDAGAHY